MTAEDFIRDYTNHCSNELTDGGYHEWLTPEQAMRAVEIAREEILADAYERTVKVDAGGYPYIDGDIDLYDYDKDIPLAKKGDKVKIIIIKDD